MIAASNSGPKLGSLGGMIETIPTPWSIGGRTRENEVRRLPDALRIWSVGILAQQVGRHVRRRQTRADYSRGGVCCELRSDETAASGVNARGGSIGEPSLPWVAESASVPTLRACHVSGRVGPCKP